MKQLLKVRIGGRGRVIEVSRREANGSGVGWRVDEHGIRWSSEKKRPDGITEETQELVVFAAKDVVCEMEEDRFYGGLRKKETVRDTSAEEAGVLSDEASYDHFNRYIAGDR